MLADELANLLRVIRDPRILVVQQDVELGERIIDEGLGSAHSVSGAFEDENETDFGRGSSLSAAPAAGGMVASVAAWATVARAGQEHDAGPWSAMC